MYCSSLLCYSIITFASSEYCQRHMIVFDKLVLKWSTKIYIQFPRVLFTSIGKYLGFKWDISNTVILYITKRLPQNWYWLLNFFNSSKEWGIQLHDPLGNVLLFSRDLISLILQLFLKIEHFSGLGELFVPFVSMAGDRSWHYKHITGLTNIQPTNTHSNE